MTSSSKKLRKQQEKEELAKLKENEYRCLSFLVMVLNYLVISGLCGASVFRISLMVKGESSSDPFFGMMTLYLIPFAGMLLVAELSYQPVLKFF